jgi:LPXTG-motif cell wall-anchored protein
LLALTTILWMAAATPALAQGKSGKGDGGGTTSSDGASGKNGAPDPEPVVDEEQASRGNNDCSRAEAGKAGGDYESTCDGTVGRNGGSGNGKCAGCDGAADNKNPPGQSRNDHNNGYECDNNGGVAKGNPAHSRCKAPPQPETPDETCPDGRPMPPDRVCGELPDVIPPPDAPDQPRVLGIRFPGVPRVPARVQPQRTGALPFTGPSAALQGFAALGAGLVAAGGLMVIGRRRKDDE